MAVIASRLTSTGTLLVNGTFDEQTDNIVYDSSLKLYLNASKTPSYPGSGTAWFDLSGNNNTTTLVGSPTYSSGAIIFNASTTTQSADVPIAAVPSGGSQVSVCCWINLGNPSTPPAASVFNCNDSAGNRIINIHLPWNDSIVYWDAGNSGGTYNRINTSTLTLAQKTGWHHWAFTKNATSGAMVIYLDGVSIASGTGKTLTLGTASTATFPCAIANFQGSTNWNGSVSSFEIYNVELTAAQVSQIYTATSAPTTKFKTTANAVYATEFDEVSLPTGAISFNGTSQYLTATSPNLSGNWTVEMWCYWTTGATQTTIVSFNNGSNSGINLWKNSSNQLVADDGVNGVVAMSTVTPTIGAWNHIAFVRVGTTTSGYVNGVLAGTTTYTPGTTSAVSVGRYNGSPFYYFPGYISNLRVVNGVAVYTSAFTPPQAILPAIPGTSLLLNVTDSTNFIRDNSTNNYTVTNNGSATFTATGPFNRGSTATAQRQVPDGTLEVYNQFDEVTGMVVTNGMIAYIDAGKPESYPGGGTTVRDLVNPDTNPATLNGTISYVSAAAASYWNFATGAAANYITSTLAQNYLDCTLVFYPDFTYNSGASLAMGLGAGISADKTMRFGSANGTGPWTLNNPDNTDGWASTATTYYVNNTAYTGAGSLASGWNIVGGLRTNTTNGAFASNFAYTWGTGFTGRYYQGRLAAIVLYNRQLTAAEQQNNYNYFAARYGLATIGL